jgi:hypothetical protein
MYVVVTQLAHCMIDMNEDLLSLRGYLHLLQQCPFHSVSRWVELAKTGEREREFMYVCMGMFSYFRTV